MNIRCSFCQIPYAISRVDLLDALQEIDSKKLTHYDAQCPRCRRSTPIPRQRMEMFMPNWRDELKKFEVEMKEHPQHEAPLPTTETTPVAEAESKPITESAKKPSSKAKPAAKTSSPKGKPAAKKSK